MLIPCHKISLKIEGIRTYKGDTKSDEINVTSKVVDAKNIQKRNQIVGADNVPKSGLGIDSFSLRST